MTDVDQDLDAIGRQYRQLKAPPTLAAQVRDGAAKTARPPAFGLAVGLAAGVVASVTAVLTVALWMQPDKASIPTMTEIARAMPERPNVSVPGLGNIRLPDRPALPKPEQPPLDDNNLPPATDEAGTTALPSTDAKEKNA
ncbi:MAG: hypothetical protein AAFZ58_07315 [Pseudomonadota bacterium]